MGGYWDEIAYLVANGQELAKNALKMSLRIITGERKDCGDAL